MPFTRRQWIVTAVLSAGCGAAFFGLRSLPVQACEVLHYGDYVNDEGIIEGCGFEETGFFDLERMRFPVVVRLEPMEDPRAGAATTFSLQLETSSGRPIGGDEVAVSHTERLHAMVVDESLQDYQHLHPQPAGAPGTWHFRFTPRRPGTYHVYLDFIPLLTARRTLAETRFEVGAGGAATPLPAELVSPDALSVRLVPESPRLRAGEPIPFRLEIEGADPLRFDPVMDSFAHLVAFAPGRLGFAHFHPRDPLIATQDPAAPDLDFVFSVAEPGPYRVWAQFSVNGVEHFVPFDLEVEGEG